MKCSGLKQQLEELAEQRSADAQQAQRESELGRRHLTAAQQQLQYKADIIHQLTGGLQVFAFFPKPSLCRFCQMICFMVTVWAWDLSAVGSAPIRCVL